MSLMVELSQQQLIVSLVKRVKELQRWRHRQLVLCYLDDSDFWSIFEPTVLQSKMKFGIYLESDALADRPLGGPVETGMEIGERSEFAGRIHRINSKDYRKILGTECDWVALDAREGMRANAVAAAAGVISGGGLLVLLLPKAAQWSRVRCTEQLRLLGEYLNDESKFIQHLESTWQKDLRCITISNAKQTSDPPFCLTMNDAICEQSHLELTLEHVDSRSTDLALSISSPMGRFCFSDVTQQQVVADIQRVFTGHGRRPLVLTADRGRGKSTALGIALALLINEQHADAPKREFWVCGPTSNSVERLSYWFRMLVKPEYATRLKIFLPHELIETLERVKFNSTEFKMKAVGVVVDEAASIPANQLARMLAACPRIVFSTTTHGYEGTGRGFSIRFKETLARVTPQWRTAKLTNPVRWNQGDPLEQLVSETFYLNAESGSLTASEVESLAGALGSVELHWCSVGQPCEHRWLAQAFALVVESHYQTTPDDLRQFWEHPKRSLLIAVIGNKVIGVIWSVEEGELTKELVTDISAGKRRVRGHLVAQSLAFHSGQANLAQKKSWRVQRIAVHHQCRRSKVGSLLLSRLATIAAKNDVDFMSTSYAASADLLPFWLQNEYWPVRLGLSLDKCTGCHSLLMVKAINVTVKKQLSSLHERFFSVTQRLLSTELVDLDPDLVMQSWGCYTFGPSPDIEPSLLNECRQYASGSRHFGDAVTGIDWLFSWSMQHLSLMNDTQRNAIHQLLVVIWQQRTLKEWQAQFNYSGIKQANSKLKEHIGELLNVFESNELA